MALYPKDMHFTSESATEGHPDKFCDQVADAILDECLRRDPASRVACDAYVAMGSIVVGGEVTSRADVNVDLVVRDVVERVIATQDRRVSILGLSFKMNTDDLRESPNVELAERLIGKGFDVRIYDPIINPDRLVGANRRYVEGKLPHLNRLLARSAEEASGFDHSSVHSQRSFRSTPWSPVDATSGLSLSHWYCTAVCCPRRSSAWALRPRVPASGACSLSRS